MKVVRMCGGALSVRRYGLKWPRRAAGEDIVDNLGLAFVYRRGRGW